MAVAALLGLEDKCALAFEGSPAVQETLWHGIAAPRIHVWAPGCVSRKVCERAQRYGDEENRQDGDGPPAPAFFSFPGKKRQEEQTDDHKHWADEKRWSFKRWGQQREQRVEPNEKIVGPWRGLNNGWIRPAGRSEWPEVNCA